MTVRQATLPELIAVAADSGFASLTTTPFLLERSGVELTELRRQCDDAGVTMGYIDGLSSPLPGTPGGVTEERCFDMAEALGAKAVNVVHFEGRTVPFAEMADVLGGVADRAARRDLTILIEFLPGTGIPDFPGALDLVRAVGHDNLRVMLDTWHLARTGGGTHQMVGDAPALIGGIQVSDRCKIQDAQPYVKMAGRYLPGEGELPLMSILAPVLAAHPELPVGVEVLNDALKAMPAADAASVAAAALRRVLAQGSAAGATAPTVT